LPNDFLSKLYVEPAVRFLENKNCRVLTNKKVSKINFENNKVNSLILEDNAEIRSDFYISAVSFFDFKNLTGEDVYKRDYSCVEDLKPSPIVNIHLRFDKNIDNIFTERFAGLLNTKTQWIFKVTNDQLCLVISAARDIAEMDKDEIVNMTVKELLACIPKLKNVNIKSSRVIKEMRATFVPDSKSLNARPGSKTNFNNFFIAGDWTDTGLPATIEGAVKSSKNCVNEIEKLI
jgi:hypothetical protein